MNPDLTAKGFSAKACVAAREIWRRLVILQANPIEAIRLLKIEGDAVVCNAEAMNMTDEDSPNPFIGIMGDSAELMDEIVEEAMRRRQFSAWLPSHQDCKMLEWVCAETGRSLYELLNEALATWLQPWHQRQEKSKQLAAIERGELAYQPIWEKLDALTGDTPPEMFEEWPHNLEGMNLETIDVCNPATRQKLMEELGHRMSHLSETAYCAGWLYGLEERVPLLCGQAIKTKKAQPFGGAVICPGLAARLLAMREKLGYWVVPSMQGGYEPYTQKDASEKE